MAIRTFKSSAHLDSLSIESGFISVFASGLSMLELPQGDIDFLMNHSFVITLNFGPLRFPGHLNFWTDVGVTKFLDGFYGTREKDRLFATRFRPHQQVKSKMVNAIDFWFEPSVEKTGGSFTLVTLLQLLRRYHAGKKILLFGVDMKEVDGADLKWHDKFTNADRVARGRHFPLEKRLENCTEQLEKFVPRGDDIFNCNVNSGLQLYPLIDFRELIGAAPAIELPVGDNGKNAAIAVQAEPAKVDGGIEVLFPMNVRQRHYRTHYRFMRNLLEHAGANVRDVPRLDVDVERFLMIVKGKKVLIDVGDFHDIAAHDTDELIYFKMHYSRRHHGQMKNVFPISPVSFHNWAEFELLKNEVHYKAQGLVIQAQREYGEAIKRRRFVASILRKNFKKILYKKLTTQLPFFKKVNETLVSVCVPGARNDILDRGQLQYMALGACTISPVLEIDFPHGEAVTPGVHYLACKDDYSDLVELIHWCESNGEKCIEIGANARALFQRCCAPEAVWRWICAVVEGEV